MMTEAMILSGAAAAADLKAEVHRLAQQLHAERGVKPGLAAVIVGENPASQVYVRNKVKTAKELGLESFEYRLPASTDQDSLIKLVEQLNNDPKVHGILVQLPLPPQIRADDVIFAIAPEKDVDGFHPVNVGRLVTGHRAFVPCTPLGCLNLIHRARQNLSGLNAVVLGRSNIVGKPVAQLLLEQNCTVTIAHSKTVDIASVAARADILVAAIGRPNLVTADWVEPGAIVIDVGINRITDESGKSKIVGDVDFEGVKNKASAITPVPGGVGLMTVAYLMANTCEAAFNITGTPWPGIKRST